MVLVLVVLPALILTFPVTNVAKKNKLLKCLLFRSRSSVPTSPSAIPHSVRKLRAERVLGAEGGIQETLQLVVQDSFVRKDSGRFWV